MPSLVVLEANVRVHVAFRVFSGMFACPPTGHTILEANVRVHVAFCVFPGMFACPTHGIRPSGISMTKSHILEVYFMVHMRLLVLLSGDLSSSSVILGVFTLTIMMADCQTFLIEWLLNCHCTAASKH